MMVALAELVKVQIDNGQVLLTAVDLQLLRVKVRIFQSMHESVEIMHLPVHILHMKPVHPKKKFDIYEVSGEVA